MDTKLHTAVRYGNLNAVLEALKDGLSPNQMGLFQWSPVHEAANNGERDILKLLIANKGDVNMQDKLHGNTPLHYSAREDNSACVTVLLKAGARIDIKNYEGMTCMDEATSLCREMIQEFVNSRNTGSEWPGGGGRNDHYHNRNMSLNGGVHGQNGGDNIPPSVPEQAAIGQLHLSFEYHRMDLKIRVWQVSDLLLPPPQISMIESIYVKSYFIPDTVKKTHRQTESVRVESQSKDSILPPQKGIQHIFSPSTFRFETPLLYTGVTPNIVAERSVQLEVCMTQKHTHKAFLMAMVHMPLRTAVRHPIREKYPLIPCMNYTIPNNMRVYSARDIIFDKSSLFLDRSPTRSSSSQSSCSCPLTLKDVYSEDVEVENFMHRASLEHSDSDCDDGVGSSFDVKSSLGKSRASSAATVDAVSLSIDNDNIPGDLREVLGLENVLLNCESATKSSEENLKPKKKIIPNELLDRIPGSEKNLTNDFGEDGKQISLINKEEDLDTNVMKKPLLQSSIVVDVQSETTKEDGKREGILQGPLNGKKKIIPAELFAYRAELIESHKPQGSHSSHHGVTDHESFDHGCLYDDIRSENKNSSGSSESDKTHLAVEKSFFIEKSKTDEYQVQNESSEDLGCSVRSTVRESQQYPSLEVADTGPSSATVSRPETPIWDFYDFTHEEGAENAADGNETVTGSSKDDASSALGTLQESILRLTRSSKALDTCRVSGPVLPSVMIEDFEMDDDDENDDDENDVDDDNC